VPEFSRGLVIEPVLPRPLLGTSEATVPHCLVLRLHTFSRQGWEAWAGAAIVASTFLTSVRWWAIHMLLRPVLYCWGSQPRQHQPLTRRIVQK
jgi:hypothetical protein